MFRCVPFGIERVVETTEQFHFPSTRQTFTRIFSSQINLALSERSLQAKSHVSKSDWSQHSIKASLDTNCQKAYRKRGQEVEEAFPCRLQKDYYAVETLQGLGCYGTLEIFRIWVRQHHKEETREGKFFSGENKRTKTAKGENTPAPEILSRNNRRQIKRSNRKNEQAPLGFNPTEGYGGRNPISSVQGLSIFLPDDGIYAVGCLSSIGLVAARLGEKFSLVEPFMGVHRCNFALFRASLTH
eukprot:Gb_40850 [translate_table: standard]